MNKVQKQAHIDLLIDCVWVEATIECEECRKVEGEYGEEELGRYAFSLGWRYINGRALCRKCVKKEKK